MWVFIISHVGITQIPPLGFPPTKQHIILSVPFPCSTHHYIRASDLTPGTREHDLSSSAEELAGTSMGTPQEAHRHCHPADLQ